jgi:hypothetical protein
MSLATTNALTGSLATLMDNLVELEKEIDPRLAVTKWRPRKPSSPFNLWNWMDLSPWQQMDTARQRDTIRLVAVIALPHTDAQNEMDDICEFIDLFRDVIDRALYTGAPLGAKEAHRVGMRLSEQTFGTNTYLSAEFPMEFKLDREIPRT